MGRVKENVYIGSRWKDNEKIPHINYCYQFVYAFVRNSINLFTQKKYYAIRKQPSVIHYKVSDSLKTKFF